MQLDRQNEDSLALYLTEKQLRVLMTCMAESFATIDRKEYALRVGMQIEEVSALARELKGLMEHLQIGL